MKSSDNARINSEDIDLYGVMPQHFDSTINDFLDIKWESKSGLSYGEQLYSAKGSQSAAVSSYTVDKTSTDPTKFNESILVQAYSSDKNRPNRYYRKRPMWVASQAPGFKMRDREDGRQVMLVSLPAFNRIISPTRALSKVPYRKINIKFKDENDKQLKRKFMQEVK